MARYYKVQSGEWVQPVRMETSMEEVKIDKRTKEYKESIVNPEILNESLDYSKVGNNPGWSKCFKCGVDLEPNPDGSPRWRSQPEACRSCIWENEGKKVGKSVREKLEEAERNGL